MVQFKLVFAPLPTPQTLEEVKDHCERVNALQEIFESLEPTRSKGDTEESKVIMRKINREFDAIFRSRFHTLVKSDFPRSGVVRYRVEES